MGLHSSIGHSTAALTQIERPWVRIPLKSRIFWGGGGLICHCLNFLSFFFACFFLGGVSVGYGRDASCMSRETSSCDETSRVSKQKRIQGMSSNIHPIFQSRELIPIALRSYKERVNLHVQNQSRNGAREL